MNNQKITIKKGCDEKMSRISCDDLIVSLKENMIRLNKADQEQEPNWILSFLNDCLDDIRMLLDNHMKELFQEELEQIMKAYNALEEYWNEIKTAFRR